MNSAREFWGPIERMSIAMAFSVMAFIQMLLVSEVFPDADSDTVLAFGFTYTLFGLFLTLLIATISVDLVSKLAHWYFGGHDTAKKHAPVTVFWMAWAAFVLWQYVIRDTSVSGTDMEAAITVSAAFLAAGFLVRAVPPVWWDQLGERLGAVNDGRGGEHA